MTVWDDVRQTLLDLQGTGALTSYPGRRETGDRPTPIQITLAPWATDAAEDLHRRFGDDVALVVGVLSYPSIQPPDWLTCEREAIGGPDGDGLRFELEAKPEVASGRSNRIGLRVHNLTAVDLTVLTNVYLTASVVDPANGECIGRDTRAQRRPIVRVTVPAGGSALIPFLIGTSSLRPELGYAVPPGQWAESADLTLEDGRVLRTTPMALTVTD